MTGRLFYWVADWNLSRSEAALLLGGRDVGDMVDCIGSELHRLIDLGAPRHIKRWAGYVTGSGGVRWEPSDFEELLSLECATMRIDQSDSDLPLFADVKVTKDLESGASLISTAVEVAAQRLNRGEAYTIYVSQAELAALEEAVAHAHLPAGRIVAYQYASPSSNPNTPIPGTTLTLAAVNADLSVVLDSWLPLPGPQTPAQKPSGHPGPHPLTHDETVYDEGFQRGYHVGFNSAWERRRVARR